MIAYPKNHIDPIEKNVHDAVQENYLGNIGVVQYLLRDLAARAIDRYDPDRKTQSLAADVEDCMKLADIFLGKDPAYAPMPSWNVEGQIDRYVSEHSEMKITGFTPREVMASVFINFLINMYELYTYAANGAKPEDWEWQVDAICDDTTNLLLGMQSPNLNQEDLPQRDD